jgi:hypothetical protein
MIHTSRFSPVISLLVMVPVFVYIFSGLVILERTAIMVR